MSRKMFIHGLALAVTLMVPALAAPKTNTDASSCCATQTRCCDQVEFCCDQPNKPECCQKGVSCCDKPSCCGPVKQAKQPTALCNVNGKPRWQCCPTKASPMPPCCQKGCGKPVRR